MKKTAVKQWNKWKKKKSTCLGVIFERYRITERSKSRTERFWFEAEDRAVGRKQVDLNRSEKTEQKFHPSRVKEDIWLWTVCWLCLSVKCIQLWETLHHILHGVVIYTRPPVLFCEETQSLWFCVRKAIQWKTLIQPHRATHCGNPLWIRMQKNFSLDSHLMETVFYMRVILRHPSKIQFSHISERNVVFAWKCKRSTCELFSYLDSDWSSAECSAWRSEGSDSPVPPPQ